MRSTLGRRLILAALTFGAVASITPLQNASAGPRRDVHIEVETLFTTNTAPFTATGSAVDDGVLCATGIVTTVSRRATGWQSDPTINFHVDKVFTCPQGEFVVRLSVHFGPNRGGFRWTVISGDGAFTGLNGSGSGIALGLPDGNPNGVLDIYDGMLVAP